MLPRPKELSLQTEVHLLTKLGESRSATCPSASEIWHCSEALFPIVIGVSQKLGTLHVVGFLLVSFWFPFGFLLASFWLPFGLSLKPSKKGQATRP